MNERTCIPSIIPLSGLTRSLPIIYLEPPFPTKGVKLASALSSLVLDYFARLKVAANHLTQGIMDSLPIPAPAAWESDVGQILGSTGVQDRFLELTLTAWDLAEFAEDCGYQGPPFRWDESRGSLIRAELDAFYFHLYEVERQNAEYILGTFPTLHRKEEARWGEYSTGRVILEIYETIAEAQQSGQPYITCLDPPPASPLMAHPPRPVEGETP